MEKKKRFSLIKFLITVLCIVSVILSASVNILFANDKTPNIFGRYIYVVGDDNPMSGDITTGAALMAKKADDLSIVVGDIVLCYPADAPDSLCLRSVSFIAEGEDGSQSFYTKDSYHEDTVDSIPKDKIVAVCTGYPESLELGRFIKFAKSLNGIIILLGAASAILIIFIIAAVIRSRSDDEEEDENYGFYEYDEESDNDNNNNSHSKQREPLYEPGPEVMPNPELERKKMSIAENFSQKQVNPDSPYQKEKERTMQFKAQRMTGAGNTISYSTSSAESAFAARNPGIQTSAAPTAETLREEMLRRTAEAERTGTYNIKKSGEPVSDNTGILSAAQVAQLRGGAAPVPQAKEAAPAPKKSSSPDISDILGGSSPRKSKSPSDMSVDDLLKMIEDEKSKL